MTILEQYNELKQEFYELENLLGLIDDFTEDDLSHFDRFKTRLKDYLTGDFADVSERLKALEDQINGVSQPLPVNNRLEEVVEKQAREIEVLKVLVKALEKEQSAKISFPHANFPKYPSDAPYPVPLIKSVEPNYPKVSNTAIDNTPINLNVDHGELPMNHTTFYM